MGVGAVMSETASETNVEVGMSAVSVQVILLVDQGVLNISLAMAFPGVNLIYILEE